MTKIILKFIIITTFFLINNIAFAQEINEEQLSPIRTRNLWYGDVQNAKGLQKGHGIYRNHSLNVNQIRYGMTDNFSFGMGLALIGFSNDFFFSGDPNFFNRNTLPITLNVEFKKPIREELYVAVGAELMGNNLSTPYRYYLVGETPRIYLTTTIGDDRRNVSLKLGANVGLIFMDNVSYINSINDVLLFGSIAAKYPLLKNIDIVGELNIDTYDRYFQFQNDNRFNRPFYYTYRLGFRVYIKEKWSIDVGIKDNSFIETINIFPYVGLSIPLYDK